MNLKTKGFIYRWFNIYLADKERKAYIASDEVQSKLNECKDESERDLILSLLVGMWEFKHGFYRVFTRFTLKNPRWFFGPLEVIAGIIKMITWDIESVLRKIRKKS